MKEFWNERYGVKEYVYGRTPNTFFRQFIDNEKPGMLLLPAEGEGRNAVFAASKGWEVFAVDFSEVARDKALEYAKKNSVLLHYDVADIADWDKEIEVDCVGLIYAHFHVKKRKQLHARLIEKLKSGGTVVLEAFSKKQLNYNSGGPGSLDMLYDLELLKRDFASLKIEFLQERTINLDESVYHRGEASVIQMIAKKIK